MYPFKDIFVFDLANNHQGDVNHAKDIIKKIGDICKTKKVSVVFKLQFRDLDTFIHKKEVNNNDNKNIKRFLSTKLNWNQYLEIKNFILDNDMKSMCTPFDEKSVDKIIEMGFDILKIASCSANDWPLLEKAANSGLPLIISTGGLSIDEIDQVVSFFEHKGTDFALMHCISIYPTPSNQSQLGFLTKLKNRYPRITIGWSTHEDPDNYDISKIAYSLGARIFERHVGIETENYKLNKYSSNPTQAQKWIESVEITKQIINLEDKSIHHSERSALNNLKRGIYLKNNFKSGYNLTEKDIYFAIPFNENQIESGMWNEDLILKNDVLKDSSLLKSDVISYKKEVNVLKSSVHFIKGILNEAKVFLSPDFEVEYSHHYGVSKFKKIGATIINCINREYCKKILVLTPGQEHPSHFHRRKEETFNLLYGDLEIWLDGAKKKLLPGENCLVLPGVWHSFKSNKGCIIEEISTTHYKNDSVYKDPYINSLKLKERKTIVPNWGRYFT